MSATAGELLADVRRLLAGCTTSMRDLDPDERDWIAAHPLYQALAEARLLSSPSAVLPVIRDWLEQAKTGSEDESIAAAARAHDRYVTGVHVVNQADVDAAWSSAVPHDMLWVVGPSHDDAPREGTRRVEYGLRATADEGPWRIPPVYACPETLARHVAAYDDADFTLVRRTVTTYSDGYGRWEEVPPDPDLDLTIGDGPAPVVAP